MQGPGDEREDGELEAEEQLTLADEDERLPWLESEDDYEEQGFDWRIVAYGVVGLLVVVGLVAAAAFLLRDGRGADQIADGSTIEAPDEPYKTRPEDPGGAQVAGTGDVSYGVGEGRGREGRVVDESPVPAPSIDREQDDEPESEEPAEDQTGVGVQVGAYSTRASAEAGWSQLQTRFEALQGVGHRVIEGTADSGTIFRLQAIAGDDASASSLCRSIRAAGGDCQVKR